MSRRTPEDGGIWPDTPMRAVWRTPTGAIRITIADTRAELLNQLATTKDRLVQFRPARYVTEGEENDGS